MLAQKGKSGCQCKMVKVVVSAKEPQWLSMQKGHSDNCQCKITPLDVNVKGLQWLSVQKTVVSENVLQWLSW